MAVYALTIFLGSFLLFQMQPLIGKYILPWYGGSPSIWTTCVLFFQLLLLAGYGYAYLLTLLDRRRQGYIHLALLLAALCFLPIAPAPHVWKLFPGEAPTLKILLLLTVNIGAPYLILSATAPLLQYWFVFAVPARSPYRLYAISNAGSLLALVSYPLLIEPRFTLSQQVHLWGWAFAAFACCCAWCGLRPIFPLTGNIPGELEKRPATMSPTDKIALPPAVILIWLCLSACGSSMLLATTNQLCQEVAVVPFLWIVPLVIYLLSYIFCFNSDWANNRRLWGVLLVVSVMSACWLIAQKAIPGLSPQVLVYTATLFVCCMACHGELARSKPDARLLTTYYLTIAAGGAIGGVFVTVVAPLLFKGFWEYPLSLTGSTLAVMLAWQREGVFAKLFAKSFNWLVYVLIAGQLALIIFTGNYILAARSNVIFSDRNFFGVLRVLWEEDDVGEKKNLLHGRTTHGWQYTAADKRSMGTTYYGPDSGAGLAIRFHPHRFAVDPLQRSLRVGIIGLGTGTLAVYGQKGDYFRYYEINPAVIWLADNVFTFKRDSAAQVEVISGDARIMMEAELEQSRPQNLDLLIVDAFSSDAIPVHLLTRECFKVYRQHLKHDGMLVLHISNRFLDLYPIVRAQGEVVGLPAAMCFSSTPNRQLGVADARWVVLARDKELLSRDEVLSKLTRYAQADIKSALWTDNFTSLWPYLNFY